MCAVYAGAFAASKPPAMLDHMTFRAADIARTHAVCVAGPSPHGGPPGSAGCHLSWRAHDRRHCHGAVVIDPDGNNVEAVGHDPA